MGKPDIAIVDPTDLAEDVADRVAEEMSKRMDRLERRLVLTSLNGKDVWTMQQASDSIYNNVSAETIRDSPNWGDHGNGELEIFPKGRHWYVEPSEFQDFIIRTGRASSQTEPPDGHS